MHKMRAVKVGLMLLGLVLTTGATGGGCDLAAILGLGGGAATPATVAVTVAATATASPIVFTATFDKDVTGLAAAGVTLGGTAHAATVAVAGSGKVYTLTVSGMTAAGTVTVVVNKDAVAAPGNDASAVATSTFAPPAPTVAVSAAVVAGTTATYTVTYSGADAVTLAAADVTLNKSGTATGTVAVAGTGTATRTVTVSGLSGEGLLSVAIAAGTASNVGVKALAATGAAFAVDTVPPTVVLGAPSLLLTNVGPVTYAVTYVGSSVVTLKAADVTLNKTGTANGTVSVSGNVVTLSALTGDGTLSISLAAGTAADAAGNLAPAVGASTPFTVQNTGPAITIGTPAELSTNIGPNYYTVYYNVNTVTLTAADITLNKTGTANGVVTVAGAGSVRTVTISNITGEGTLGITVAAGTGKDTLGNGTLAATSSTFAVDTTAPTVTTIALATGQTDPALTPTVSFLVTFSEPVTKPSLVTVLGAAFSGGATKVITTSAATSPSATWTVNVTGMDQDAGAGAITVQIPASSVLDAAGNLNAVASSVFTLAVYDKVPTATMVISTSPPADFTNVVGAQATPAIYKLTFSKALVGVLTAAMFTPSGTSGANTVEIANWNQTTADVKVYTAAPGTMVDGTVAVALKAGSLKDAAGNSNAAASAVVTRDTAKPDVVVSLASGQTVYSSVAGPFSFVATFSEAVKPFAVGAVSIAAANQPAGTAVTLVSGGPTAWTITVGAANANAEGDVVVTIPAGGVTDVSGFNTNNVSTGTAKVTVYQTQPVLVSAEVAPDGIGKTVNVLFNHDMDAATVNAAATYTFAGGSPVVTNAALSASNKKLVVLTTDVAVVANKTLTVATTPKDMVARSLLQQYASVLPYYDNTKLPFAVVSATKLSNTTVDVLFSHWVDPVTAVVVAKYNVNNGVGAASAAVVDAVNPALVHLTFAGQNVTGNVLTVTGLAGGVKDFAGGVATNTMAANFVSAAFP